MTGELVVDASVVLKWLVDEPDVAWARRVATSSYVLIAPDLLHSEVANALWRIRRKGLLSERQHFELYDRLSDFNLQFLVLEHPLHAASLALATRLDHPVYDCLYLALALARGAALATADTRFARAIRRADALPDRLVLTPPEAASPPA
ncbi:type II toxin-antitoxin system VapC family toxin [Paracraurococcus lichenis]|uniref:Ribonuclease VapC n=1 Tax=Paracraurococcus lichenis TaxID=3064888 RepID=A0ABT9DZ54_9PROT|nr:type II toxin-antitoxin system VapC family toxin [Paracraurococcus sp. LOR1-02]MDO9709169.1 type II toxin-antitoxin system VapC family toxin [Paracraurococcus sp. LOR1-02]